MGFRGLNNKTGYLLGFLLGVLLMVSIRVSFWVRYVGLNNYNRIRDAIEVFSLIKLLPIRAIKLCRIHYCSVCRLP